ncbi:MAG: DNA gyrase/topoisomerase IV subunit A [Bacteroidaceae bacterium]|nr:DNA gyrase/topoisomerase IV subunit A [Bacteroidaceae bacterium]
MSDKKDDKDLEKEGVGENEREDELEGVDDAGVNVENEEDEENRSTEEDEEDFGGDEYSTSGQPPKSDYDPTKMTDSITHHLSGMYQNWFLDYASYVILERAVPHIMDGLKPVQRRILHSMKRMDDGRYNKVANIVGHTMQFHPHGDASIKDALVQMGQKELLIDHQGNWGNILTGDDAAAGRYIEARLSKFALDVVFNPKTTEWKLSYDGRNKEPIALPVKFPLLLAQGVEGIAVGLSSKILPHNFNEICDAAVDYLYEKPFQLYPDFLTGGSIDVSKYNDGQRGGSVKVRAKIEKLDNKTLVIREIPFSKTSESLIDTITKAVEKGKIKARKIEDNTAAEVEILVHLVPGVSSDKQIDALYAFTDCEISISPNCCVVDEKMPQFLTVSDVLKRSVDYTKFLIKRELEIRRGEILEQLHFASLEKIFIEERIYKGKEFEQAPDMDSAIAYVDKRLEPYKETFVREVTRDDILRLMEIKMARILKFNKDKADELIAKMKAEIDEINKDLANLIEVTANWFRYLKQKYGADHPRLTEIRNFDTIQAATVAEANQKLYINRADGFIGTGLKKDEYVCNCSDIDDIILFYRDGTYKVVKVTDKLFVGETEKCKKEKRKAEIIHIAVFKKNDARTIYNVCYKDGASGVTYIKRFNVTTATRDREYDVTSGTPKSRITYFSANANGEAEIIKVTLKPHEKIKKLTFDKDFSEIAIKGRSSRGNQLTKNEIFRIQLKAHGGSTLGGRKVWYDKDVQRLNYDEHGMYLGEFHNEDQILVILDNGEFYTTNFDINNHYEQNIDRIEKYDSDKVWTAVLWDADNNNYPYIKRFLMDSSSKKQNYLSENPDTKLILLTDTVYPRLLLKFNDPNTERPDEEIDAEQFISVKGFKAKGKRLTTLPLESVTELEPTRLPEPKETEGEDEDGEVSKVVVDPDEGKSDSDIRDEITGQLKLF